jgi:hypothetical protein
VKTVDRPVVQGDEGQPATSWSLTMVIIRCTRKLLQRIGPPSPDSPPSTTLLGDWYAGPVAIGHQRLLLLISARSRLPVILPGRDVKHLAQNFPEALARVLLGLGIPATAVDREVEATREALIATTNSRSLLGTLNDFSFLLKWELQGAPAVDLVEAALRLSGTPVAPLGPGFPDQVTRQLLREE